MNTQINIAIPKEWKEELERLARVYLIDGGNNSYLFRFNQKSHKRKVWLKRR